MIHYIVPFFYTIPTVAITIFIVNDSDVTIMTVFPLQNFCITSIIHISLLEMVKNISLFCDPFEKVASGVRVVFTTRWSRTHPELPEPVGSRFLHCPENGGLLVTRAQRRLRGRKDTLPGFAELRGWGGWPIH